MICILRSSLDDVTGGNPHTDYREKMLYLQEEDVLGEPLDWFEEEALQTEAGLALVVLSSEERDKFSLLLDRFL